jgi:peptidoglycan/LPS O-acetylase OafA/YrhL
VDSPNRPRNLEVDQLRGAAALLVLFYHSVQTGLLAAGASGWPRAHYGIDALLFEGHTGVALFMVLSGYILASGTFDREIDYLKFLRNRALRIFPLMFVALVFAMYSSTDLDLGKIIAPFILLANTTASFSDPAGLAGTVWTAAVEFQFYLVAPFVFMFVGRNGLKYLLGTVLLFWLLRMIVLLPHGNEPLELYKISYFTIVGRINQFLTGVGLAYVFHTGILKLREHRGRAAFGLAICGIVVLAAMTALNHSGGITAWRPWRIVYPELEGLLWTAFLAAYLISRPLENRYLGKWFYRVGQISFSMYILHYAIQREWWTVLYPKFFNGWITHGSEILLVTMVLAAVIMALSHLSYICIEKPFQDMRGGYLKPSPSSGAAS